MDAVLLVDDAMCIVGANSSASRLTGYPPDDLRGRSLDILTPSPIQTLNSAWPRLLGGEIVDQQVLVARDGSRVLADVQAMKDVLPGIHLAVLHDVGRYKSTEKELARRVDQQAAVACLGQRALGLDVDELLGEVVGVVSDGLSVEFVSILQLTPNRAEFDVRAGVGWREGIVGTLRIPAGPGSLPGFTLCALEPVVVHDVSTETRFGFTPVIEEHGIASAMAVVVGSPALPWGVLAACTSKPRGFTEHDGSFLQSVANVLAAAIERADRDAALRAAERDYRELVERSPLGIIRVTSAGELIFSNAAMLTIFGYASMTDLASGIAEQMRSPSTEYAALADRILREGSLTGFEVETIRSDGSPIWISVGARSVEQPDGTQGFEAVISDITAKKAAEAALLASEERFRLISELISDYAFAFHVDAGGRPVLDWLTGDVRRTFGYGLEDLAFPEFFGLTHPDDLPAMAAAVQQAVDGRAVSVEARFATAEGKYRWINISARPIVDPDTGALASVVGAAKDITAQRDAEQALHDSEGRFRTITELISDYAFVFKFDDSGALILDWMTGSIGRDFGYDTENISPLPLVELTHPEDLPEALEKLAALTAGQTVEVVARFKRADGTYHWMHTLARPSFDPESGAVTGVLAAAKDITVQREAEQALRLSEERLRYVLSATPAVVFTFDADAPSDLSFVSENAMPTLGYEPAFCTRPGFLRATVHADDWEHLESGWSALLRDRRYAREIRFQHGDGEWHWLRTEVALATDAHGEPVEGVGYFVDVTERKRAEDEASARESSLRLVLGQLPVILWTTDEDLRITAMLGAGLPATGIAEANVLGGHFADVGDNPNAVAVGAAAHRALSGEVVTDDFAWEGRTWRTRVEPLRGADDVIRGVTGISFDVTEAVKAKQDLEVTVRALRRSDERRGHLLQRIVNAQEEERLRIARELHDDLGQRLTSAALFASALEQQWPAEHPEAAHVFTLRRLVEEAMTSTRSIVWNLRPLELDDLGLPAAIRRLATEVSSGNTVEVDVHATDIERQRPEVETTIYRVVQEALTNAVRHSGASSISVVLGTRDGRVVAIVEDDGKGFDLFTVIERGSDTNRLGLIGMHERADSIGGTLLIETEAGSGVTVRLELPLGPRTPA